MTAAQLTDDERETAYLLGEELIPPQDGELSADQAGVSAEFLDRVLALRPDLVPPFRELLGRARDQEPRDFCERLMADEPAEFQKLTFVLAGAYLMSPRVRTRLKYRGQIGEPQLGGPQPEYTETGILTQVRERGPIYRPTPD
ncbi:hypothetical protein [Nocardia carnea]|uniref:hypothetical protein n=1 Tax=Nocardia carnea TaxID=37328 RepID=UPI0024590B9F|nr:hypothetical protein [Nocardia carnea]